MEKIQEAAFTEIINKESLNYLQELENERVFKIDFYDKADENMVFRVTKTDKIEIGNPE